MREVPEAARDYSVIAARLRGPVFSLGLPAEEVELLASKEVLAAAATAQSIAFLLQDECATPLGGVGMDSSRYIRLMLDLIAATNAYREAMRKDIGAA